MLIIMFYMLQIGFRKVSLIDCALSFEMCVRSLALANNKTTETNVEGKKTVYVDNATAKNVLIHICLVYHNNVEVWKRLKKTSGIHLNGVWTIYSAQNL